MFPPVQRPHVQAAQALIAEHVRRTPLIDAEDEFFGVAASVTLKLELLQHTGSFKPRGALHRALTSDIPDAGLIAASGGNHGIAVAWVAKRLGVRAEIFVPEISPPAKIAKLHDLGATVHVGGARYDDAAAQCRTRQAETGALDIHAYDHPATLAGAGTIGYEIDDALARQARTAPDTVLVSLGGGGLAAGLAAWYRPTATKVVTVEPERSQCYAAAVGAGEPVEVEVDGIAADSLGARRIGEVAWAALRAANCEPVVVTDADIRAAQRRFFAGCGLVVEPGGAAAAAALWSGSYVPAAGETVAVVVCGTNCDPSNVV